MVLGWQTEFFKGLDGGEYYPIGWGTWSCLGQLGCIKRGEEAGLLSPSNNSNNVATMAMQQVWKFAVV